jgi:hypothetical protein
MFELNNRELVLISLAIEEKLTFYKNRMRTAHTEEFKEFLEIRIAELNEINGKLGF